MPQGKKGQSSVRLEPAVPHGISQSGLALRAGRAYAGRVALAGSPGARVSVSLAWGPGPGDRQTIPVPALTARYATFPLEFTAGADTSDGRLEIVEWKVILAPQEPVPRWDHEDAVPEAGLAA